MHALIDSVGKACRKLVFPAMKQFFAGGVSPEDDYMSMEAMSDAIAEPLMQEFEEIFREHSGLVFGTACSITHNGEDAEDVVQTVFLRLLRRGIPPEFQKNPKAYLYR